MTDDNEQNHIDDETKTVVDEDIITRCADDLTSVAEGDDSGWTRLFDKCEGWVLDDLSTYLDGYLEAREAETT
jgi:hypothetical protein